MQLIYTNYSDSRRQPKFKLKFPLRVTATTPGANWRSCLADEAEFAADLCALCSPGVTTAEHSVVTGCGLTEEHKWELCWI